MIHRVEESLTRQAADDADAVPISCWICYDAPDGRQERGLPPATALQAPSAEALGREKDPAWGRPQ
jgi:hypothetical protein